LQAVERLHQQLAALPAGLSTSPEKPFATEQQNMLKSLPVQARQGQIWVDLQQALTAGGLNLLSLRPLPPSLAQASAARLPSQAVAVRLSGRFEDWSRVWAAFTQAGPVCSIDRISLAATAHPEEVQIDAVLRVWLRPGDVGVQAQAEPEGAWDGLTWLEPSQSGRSGVILFAQARQTGAASGGDAHAPGRIDQRPAPQGRRVRRRGPPLPRPSRWRMLCLKTLGNGLWPVCV